MTNEKLINEMIKIFKGENSNSEIRKIINQLISFWARYPYNSEIYINELKVLY